MVVAEKTRIYEEKWFSETSPETKLLISACTDCGENWFPIKKVCPNCFNDQLENKELSSYGKVYSHTTLHVTAKNFKSPLQIAYVDFPGNVRVCGQVEGEGLKIGAKVQLTFGQISEDTDGTKVYSYKFKTIEQ